MKIGKVKNLIGINDLALPDVLREHGEQFSNSVRYVTDVGDNGYILYAKDSELLDMVYLSES